MTTQLSIDDGATRNPSSVDSPKIYFCSGPLGIGGGTKTYISSLLNYQIPGVSDELIVPSRDASQSHYKLLHIHEDWILNQLRRECPAVYSLHNHDPYCPSGTKYLFARNTCCDRTISPLGCTWGRYVGRCGSRLPARVVKDIGESYQYLKVLKTLNIPVITYSHYVRNQLLRHGLSPQQVVTLYYGIEPPLIAAYPLTREIHCAQRILFVGRIVPDKGVDWLLKALAQLPSTIHLDIAGEGWDQPRLEQLAEQLGVSDRVTWHGWCDGEKLERLYQQCFALVFPSLWPEPAGIVTLEAYARYRPVIASQTGGIPEHIRPDETGLLVPTNDVNHLAAAINYLAQDFDRAREIGEAGHADYLNRFTLDHHVKTLQEIYAQVIAQFSPC
jgi:glycosyltransferase involved in cell wall biosynthesis